MGVCGITIKDKIREVVTTALNLRESKIVLKDDDILFGKFAKLGFDSLDFLALVAALAEAFKLKIEHFTAELLKKEDLIKPVESINTIAEWIERENQTCE